MNIDDLIEAIRDTGTLIVKCIPNVVRLESAKEERERILLLIDKFFAGMLDEVKEDNSEEKILPHSPQHVLLETVRRRLKTEINLDNDKIDKAFRSSAS